VECGSYDARYRFLNAIGKDSVFTKGCFSFDVELKARSRAIKVPISTSRWGFQAMTPQVTQEDKFPYQPMKYGTAPCERKGGGLGSRLNMEADGCVAVWPICR
jgi:hypothetical protein